MVFSCPLEEICVTKVYPCFILQNVVEFQVAIKSCTKLASMGHP